MTRLQVTPMALRLAVVLRRTGEDWATEGQREIRMPPRSYIIAAVVLGALVGISFFLTLGFSMTVWSWMFSIAACILGVVGVFQTAGGLGAPSWIGVALASPGLVWAVGNLHEWIQPTPASSIRYDLVAAALAAMAAGAGALKLIETISRISPP